MWFDPTTARVNIIKPVIFGGTRVIKIYCRINFQWDGTVLTNYWSVISFSLRWYIKFIDFMCSDKSITNERLNFMSCRMWILWRLVGYSASPIYRPRITAEDCQIDVFIASALNYILNNCVPIITLGCKFYEFWTSCVGCSQSTCPCSTCASNNVIIMVIYIIHTLSQVRMHAQTLYHFILSWLSTCCFRDL